MGSSQSKIRGTSLEQNPADSTKIKDFVKSSFSSLCHIDSTETLQPIEPDTLAVAPNRFTVKAILKSPKESVDSGCVLDSPLSTSTKSSVGFQFDKLERSLPKTSCWSCYHPQQSNRLSIETYSPSAKSSTSQLDSLRSMRMSTASLSSRRSMQQFDQAPIYQSTSGDFYIAFDLSRFVFSNDFVCPNNIHVDGHCFPTSEHCYLYQKALFHGNKHLVEKILEESDVDVLRKLMASMTHHDGRWSKVQVGAMRRSCLAKFTQNPSLRTELFRTGSATLVAAIPDDCKWGIGLNVDDPDVANMNKWRGSNLLGQVLMAVRTLLASQYNDEYQNEQSVAEKRQEKCSKRHN